MRRAITWALTSGHDSIDVVMLDASIEDAVRAAVTKTAAGTFLTLSLSATKDILDAIEAAVAGARPAIEGEPIFLTRPDIRRFVRRILEPVRPRARVIAYSELLPEIRINCLARATLVGR